MNKKHPFLAAIFIGLILVLVTACSSQHSHEHDASQEGIKSNSADHNHSKAGISPDSNISSAQRIEPAPLSPDLDPVLKDIITKARSGTHGYEITRALTTEVGPRLAGTAAEARARDWALSQFRKIGLENVHVEPFNITGWVRGVETARIISPYPQNLVVTALGGSVATPDSGIIAPIAYFEDFDALISAPETGLEGQIVFISGHMERAPDGAGYGPANRKRRSGASEAAKRGAAAVIIRSVGTDSHRFAHTGQMRYDPAIKAIPIGALSAPDADQLERAMLAAKEIDEPVELHLTLTPRVTGEQISGNVIGDIIGSERPEEIILMGAHLDSWDQGTGAIDDGAGIGIVAGAAQILIENGLRPKRTIRIVAFGAEEVGLLGGYAYAERHKAALANHMLASESDFGAGQPYVVLQGALSGHEAISQMAQALGLAFDPETPTKGGPDIGPLHAQGVPAMRFQQNGFDYFDFHHTPDDTFDKINAKDMGDNVAAFAVMAWIAGNTDETFRQAEPELADTKVETSE